MALLKIEPFIIDSTADFTFANANITSNLLAGNANLGNLATANFFSGNGSLITYLTGANVNGQVGNAAIAGTVYTNAQPNITSVGTLANLVVGNATANATFGNGTITLTSAGSITGGNLLSATYLTGTLTTAAQPNITSVGTLTGLTVNGDITSTGNLIVAGQTTYVNSTNTAIEDPLIYQGGGANNAVLTSDDGHDRGTILNYYTGGAATQAFMGWKNASGEFEFASNVSVTTGVATVATYGNIKAGSANLGNSVTSNYFIGNGSTITYITGANVNGQVGNAAIAGTVYTNAQPNITSVGTLTAVSVSGNANVANLTANGVVNFTSTSNVALGAVGNVKVTGGMSGQYLTTDGSGNLSWTTVTSSFSVISNGTSNLNIPTVNGNVVVTVGGSAIETISASGSNVTGYISATGNINGANANLGNLVTANYTTAVLTTAAQPNITSVGTLTSLTVSGTTNLGAVANVTITGGSANYVLATNGSGTLSWAAQQSLSATVDEFTGNGVQVAFTLSSTPVSKNVTFAAVQGVLQPKSSYSVSGAILTFSQAPPNLSLVEITTLTVG